MPLFKCLLAAISVLRCVDAVAPSTTVAFEKMMRQGWPCPRRPRRRRLVAEGLHRTRRREHVHHKEDKERVEKKCSGEAPDHKCRKMCRPKYKKLSTGCKAACCPSFTPCQGTLAQFDKGFDKGNITTLNIN